MEVKGQKVLVADDEPDILEIIEYNLRLEGYDVYTAKDGDEAVQKQETAAREMGWMSEFGHSLIFDSNGIAVCEESKVKYQIKEGQVSKL